MSLMPRWVLVGLVLVLNGSGFAQSLPESEKPAKHVPRRALSRQELDRREAQRLYGVGTLHERSNR